MKKIRQIKKWGNGHIISLTQIDLRDMELEEGDFVDISCLVKVEQKTIKRKRGKNEKRNTSKL